MTYYQKAMSARQQGDHKKAIQDFNDVLKYGSESEKKDAKQYLSKYKKAGYSIKSKSFTTRVIRILGFFLVISLLVNFIVFFKGCNLIDGHSEPDYESVRVGVRSLVEAQSSYNCFRTKGVFADSMQELGYARDGGDVMLEKVWKANYVSEKKVPYESYYFTTFSLEDGKFAVALAIPRGNDPYFISLYGENGVSMMRSSATPIYWNFNKKYFTPEFLDGKIDLATVKSIIEKSERVTTETFSTKNKQ